MLVELAVMGVLYARSQGIKTGTIFDLLPEADFKSEMPPVHDYPVQSSAIGTPIPIVLGTTRLAGNVIYMGDQQAYYIKHKSGGKGGGEEQVSYEVKYKRSFILAICEGPATILRAWKGKKEIDITDFTIYDGDDNSGISTLIGKNYAEYSNICLAYFEDSELGNSGTLPNYVFEVLSGFESSKTIFMGGNVSGGNHLWKIKDTGTELTLLNSYALDGNIIDMKYLPVAKKLLIAIGTKIYCYHASDITLDTSWGTNGIVDVGGTVWRINVDSSDFCVVVHNLSSTYRVRLLNASGSIVWQIAAGNSASVAAFDPNGNVLVGNGATHGGRIDRYSRTDGSLLATVRATLAPAGYQMNTILSHPTDVTQVYNNASYTSGFFDCIDTDGANDWVHNIPNPGLCYDSCFMTSVDKVVFLGDEVHIADPLTGANLLSGGPSDITRVDFSSLDEIYVSENGGVLHVYNTSIVEQRSLDLSLDDIYGCVLIENIAPDSATDKNFAEMIKELLINEKYGGYSESDLITEDFNSIIAYCETNNFKGSLAITTQRPLPDWIAYICSHFQGYFYEIGGKVGLNCYRDQASVLSVTQDDLVRDGDEPPIHITKRAYSSTFNRLEAAWTDRDNDYRTAVLPAFDRIDQRESGQVRTKIMDIKAITNGALASKMAWRIFIDQFYRFSQYNFRLGYKSMLLEIGDVIDVTDGHILTAQKMRVISIDEEKDGRTASISAVEDIAAFYPDIAYAAQQSQAVGDSNIVLTDGTVIFREGWDSNHLYLSIIPGGTQCNGFYIYMSYDDASYELVGRSTIAGVTGGDANSTGTMQSNLPAHTAVIHRAGEWFDVSIGTLTDLDTSITDDNFFNNRKLARIGNEIIGYKTCVESAVEGTWRVSNLIRGLFGTQPVAHVSGETFSTLDINFIYTIQPSDIGKTLYFKVVSFYADEIQSVSEVSSQSYTVSGDYVKPLPVSLMRINGREGLTTYKTDDVTIDWYFCSKESGFGRGGYGNALWGAYTVDPLLEKLRVELEEEDGTAITDSNYELSDYGDPPQLEILLADRASKNPVRVKMTPGSFLLGNETRDILIEKI